MRWSTVRLLAAAVMAAGAVGVLASCSAEPTEGQPTPPASTPEVRWSANPTNPADRTVRGDVSARAPLGLEVRYVDENGKFTTLRPEDFPG